MNGFNIDNTGVIFDSDRTMTKGSYENPEGGKRIDYTSYSILEKHGKVSQNFFDRVNRLYNYYVEIERNPEIGKDEKSAKMLEWVIEVNKLYSEYISEDIFQDALEKGIDQLHMRQGTKEFLAFLRDHNIPILIFSAGISNVIERVLAHNGFSAAGIHVLGNRVNFDQNGMFITPDSESIIHPENKHWDSVPFEIQEGFKGRANQIVLGDSTGDIYMGDSQRNIHSIGFLLQANNDPEGFRDLYSQVIESEECDLGELKKIQDVLLANS